MLDEDLVWRRSCGEEGFDRCWMRILFGGVVEFDRRRSFKASSRTQVLSA
ncbi:unnamed protein product [Rhodiola kirilowii]